MASNTSNTSSISNNVRYYYFQVGPGDSTTGYKTRTEA
jgi:hypothetical protein